MRYGRSSRSTQERGYAYSSHSTLFRTGVVETSLRVPVPLLSLVKDLLLVRHVLHHVLHGLDIRFDQRLVFYDVFVGLLLKAFDLAKGVGDLVEVCTDSREPRAGCGGRGFKILIDTEAIRTGRTSVNIAG